MCRILYEEGSVTFYRNDYEVVVFQACPNHAELVMTDSSPVLVYQISSDSTRILVDVKGTLPKDLRGYLRDNIAEQLPGEMLNYIDSFYGSDDLPHQITLLKELTFTFHYVLILVETIKSILTLYTV